MKKTAVLPTAVVQTRPQDVAQPPLSDATWLARLFDSLEQGIAVYGPDMRLRYWNAAIERITSIKHDAIVGRFAWDVIPESTEEFLRPLLVASLKGETTTLDNYSYVHAATREPGWAHVRISPLRDSEGTVFGVFATVVDVTDRKKLGDALVESEQRLKLIIEHEPDCVKLMDREGRISYMNPAGLSILDATDTSQVQGMRVEDMLRSDHRDSFRKALSSVFSGRPMHLRFEGQSLTGRRRWLDSRMVPIRDREGNVTAALGLTRDVTGQYKLDKERDRLFDQLKQANEDLNALSQIAGSTRSLDLQELISDATSKVRAALQSQFAAAVLLERDSLRVAACFGFKGGSERTLMSSVGLDDAPAGHLPASHPLISGLFPELSSAGVGTVYCAPLESAGRTVGALVVGRSSKRLSVREARLVRQAADRIAGGVVNAQLYTQLEESQEHLHYAMDAAVLGGFDWNVVTGEAKWFGHHERMFGFQPGEFDGTISGFYSRIHPDDREGIAEAVERALVRHLEYRHRYRVIWPDGTVRWIEGFGNTTYSDSGNPLRMGGVVMDITERVVADRKAESIAAHYRQLGEMITDFAFIATLDEKRALVVDWVSDSITRVFGYTLEDLRTGWKKLLHPDELSLVPDTLKRVASSEKVMVMRRWVTKDGKQRWIRLYVVPLVDPHSGLVKSIMGAAEDITEAKLAQEQARAHQERFELAAMATNDVIWDGDLRTGTVRWGANMVSVFGHEQPSEPVATGFWRDHIHPDDAGTVSTIVTKCLASNESFWSAEYRFRKADGTYAHVLDRAHVQRDAEGKPTRMIGAMMDLTDRVNAERERERLMQELRQANEDLQAMSSITEGTHGMLDLDELLREYVFRVAKAVGSDIAGIVLIEDGKLVLKQAYGVPESLRARWTGSIGEGFIGHVSQTREPLFVSDAREHPPFVGMLTEKLGLRGMFAVPIERAGDCVGVLGIGWKRVIEPNLRFERILASTAERVALAILNARLFTHLRLTQESLQRALDASVMGVFDWNLETGHIEWIGHHDRLFGLGESKFQGDFGSFVERAHPDDRPMLSTVFEEARKHLGEYNHEFRVVWPDHTVHWIGGQGRYEYDASGKPIRVSGVVREITARKEAEEALRHLSQHLQKVREEERATLARTVHDDLGQALTALKMEANWAKRLLPDAPRDLGHHLDLMLNQIDSTISRVREISSELRPGVLDDLGLCAAIDWEAREFSRRTAIKCIVQGTNKDVSLDRDATVAFYRILQEALTNVARHAHAMEVIISLRLREGKVSLSIRDNGVGASQEDLNGREALGILGMRERAEAVGATLEVRSSLDSGTSVTVRVPLYHGTVADAQGGIHGQSTHR